MAMPQSKAELRTTVPTEVVDALDLMVRLGSISKATIVRIALVDHLTTHGVLFPEVAQTLPTKTRGRLSSDRSIQKDDR